MLSSDGKIHFVLNQVWEVACGVMRGGTLQQSKLFKTQVVTTDNLDVGKEVLPEWQLICSVLSVCCK